MNQPSVTLTDYLITLICLGFTWYFYQVRDRNILCYLWGIFFGAVALASLLGGTIHGFYPDKTLLMHQIFWPATLLLIGITAATCWILGGFFLNGRQHLSKWITFAVVLFLVYACLVIFYSQNYLLAILNYLPAILFLFIVVIICYLKTNISHFCWIFAGILLSFIAAFIQQTKVAIHPIYLDHNSIYHLLQACAFWFIFIGAKGLAKLRSNA